jgi:Lipoprotein signal peptidase
LGNFFRITLVLNPNTAFGISLGENFPYAPVSGALALFVLYLLVKEKNIFSKTMYSLILAGALGNITDRIINGAVVDFIDLGIGNLRWFTFNLADVFVSLGIAGLIIGGFIVKNESFRSYGGVRERAYDSGEGN